MTNTKTLILGLTILILTFSCEKNNNCEGSDSPVGKWKLVEQYLDPGDGSGEYRSVNSNRELILNEDRTFTANEDLCDPFAETAVSSSGFWVDSTSASWATGQILTTDCELRANWLLIDDGCTLELTYPCIEGCGQRYERQ